MPRSKKLIPKREIKPDPIFKSRLVTRFISKIMKDGKKTIASKIVYGAFEIIKSETKNDPVKTFESAIINVSPKMEVRPRRIGGASYQVPMEVRGNRREALAIKWLIEAAKSKSAKDNFDKKSKHPVMAQKLANELIAAANSEGIAVDRKENMHRVADANRAFAHFRW
jgi:small subunit ribosomal protein S7